jgi:alginate O-acetyltransferase complex protein AlgI
MGMSFKAGTLNIVLPVGISFYTFQTLSYSIDAYKKKLEPTNDFFAFMAYVSFFPQLVAGPIERAKHLLPQFYVKRRFDYLQAVDGTKQILWGLFKKLVIADNCAIYANQMFNNTGDYSGTTLILGAVFFAFQIYGDFSGYSDVAIGTARLFGFDLRKNFAFPYFSRDIAEFWRRWHISLSTWFRDYLYIPLGGSRGSKIQQIRNTFIIFLVSGFWHGANWTFIFWGGLNALFFLPLLLTQQNRKHIEVAANSGGMPSFREITGILTTFGLTTFAWIFFRAQNLQHAFDYIAKIFSGLFTKQSLVDTYILTRFQAPYIIILLTIFVWLEWLGRRHEFAIQQLLGFNRTLRWAMYVGIVFLIGMYMPTNESPFIYFQF